MAALIDRREKHVFSGFSSLQLRIIKHNGTHLSGYLIQTMMWLWYSSKASRLIVGGISDVALKRFPTYYDPSAT